MKQIEQKDMYLSTGVLREQVIQVLLSEARRGREQAYAPYSNFYVGAALLCADGKVYTGANVENASYGATVCAERVAVGKAVSEGHRHFVAIAVVGGAVPTAHPEKGEVVRAGVFPEGTLVDCPPCGICRQVLREFCDPEHFCVITAASDGSFEMHTLEQLLPRSFGPAQLG